jgi:hypothetical protein
MPPGTVSLEPACQPLPPGPGIARPRLSAGRDRVARTRRLPCYSRAREACTARRCQSSPEPPRPCRAGPRHRTPAPLSLPCFSSMRYRTRDPHPLPCLPRLCFKRRWPSCHALFSFSPSLPSAYGHKSITRPLPFSASCPRRRPSHRDPRRVSDRRRFSPPQ